MTVTFPDLTIPVKVGLRVEDYMLLAESGAFDDYGRTELIDGDIYVMNAQHSRHARMKSRLLYELIGKVREIASDLEAVCEVAVRVSGDGMPEPDIVLTSWRGEGPVPVETVALVVEVADTTLRRDLGRKADLYAAAGVPEYWVLDLNERYILKHEGPQAEGYRGRTAVSFGETIAATTIAGLEIETTTLLD